MGAILGGLFNSRLNMNLREEKGYTYGASAGFDLRRARGPFTARAAVNTEVTVPAIHEFLPSWTGSARRRSPTPSCGAARDFLVGVFPLRFETPGPVAGSLAGLFVHGLPDDELDRYRGAIEAVTADDVQRVARAHIRPEAAAIVLVGDDDAVRRRARGGRARRSPSTVDRATTAEADARPLKPFRRATASGWGEAAPSGRPPQLSGDPSCVDHATASSDPPGPPRVAFPDLAGAVFATDHLRRHAAGDTAAGARQRRPTTDELATGTTETDRGRHRRARDRGATDREPRPRSPRRPTSSRDRGAPPRRTSRDRGADGDRRGRRRGRRAPPQRGHGGGDEDDSGPGSHETATDQGEDGQRRPAARTTTRRTTTTAATTMPTTATTPAPAAATTTTTTTPASGSGDD